MFEEVNMFAYKAVVEVHSKVNLWLSINRYTGARYFFSRFEFRTLFHLEEFVHK